MGPPWIGVLTGVLADTIMAGGALRTSLIGVVPSGNVNFGGSDG